MTNRYTGIKSMALTIVAVMLIMLIIAMTISVFAAFINYVKTDVFIYSWNDYAFPALKKGAITGLIVGIGISIQARNINK